MARLKTVSARLYNSQVKEIDRLARRRGIDRSDAIRRLIDEGLKKEKVEEALEKLRGVSVWAAAEMAGISYREMLELMKVENVPFPLGAEGLRRELDGLLKGME
ncbi:MAG: ribbon-helix-helix protein, CopG family [Euryarchaeota archaeon]|nr:ribbon-helix-helix protein, CopG family [Euryarchaeota archaeon]